VSKFQRLSAARQIEAESRKREAGSRKRPATCSTREPPMTLPSSRVLSAQTPPKVAEPATAIQMGRAFTAFT
jgi:hypothetical protein